MGISLLSGAVQAAAVALGVVAFVLALLRAINSDDFVRSEPPVPPGVGGGVG